MKNRVFISFVLILIISGFTISSADNKMILIKKLTWSNFTGKVDVKSPYDAMTYWNVNYEYDAPVIKGNNVNINFRVWNMLGPNSWVKWNTLRENQKAELLNHEQGHFDLGLICALEAKKNLLNFKYTKTGYHNEIKIVFNDTMKKIIGMEKKYDFETNHMNNRTAQKKWDQFFKNRIAELKQ